MLGSFESPLPQMAMGSIRLQPSVKGGYRDGESFTQSENGFPAKGIFNKKTENKEKTVGVIRDDRIRENGVGVTTRTFNPKDTNLPDFRDTVQKVNDIAVIVGVLTTVAAAFADGTGFHFRIKGHHTVIKQRFCRIFYLNKVAI